MPARLNILHLGVPGRPTLTNLRLMRLTREGRCPLG